MIRLASCNLALYVFFLLQLWIPDVVGANPPPSTEKAKARLEELFLWKVSDTLELSTSEEEVFKKNFKMLNEKKAKAAQELDLVTANLENSKSQKNLGQTIERYNKSLAAYNNIQLEEVRTMRKILGDRRLAQYLILKRDLSTKIKNMLSTPSRPESNSPKD